MMMMMMMMMMMKVTSRHGMLSLQRNIYLPFPAFNINSYGNRAFSVTAPQYIRDAGSLEKNTMDCHNGNDDQSRSLALCLIFLFTPHTKAS